MFAKAPRVPGKQPLSGSRTMPETPVCLRHRIGPPRQNCTIGQHRNVYASSLRLSGQDPGGNTAIARGSPTGAWSEAPHRKHHFLCNTLRKRAVKEVFRLQFAPMYIQTVANRKSPPCMLLRQDHHRVGKRVVKKTLANITDWPDHVVEGLRVLPKRGALDDSGQGCRITGSPPHGHAAVPGTLRKPGLDRLIACRPSPQPQCIVAMNCARAIDPRSKLAAVRKKRPALTSFSVIPWGALEAFPMRKLNVLFFLVNFPEREGAMTKRS